MKIFLSYSSEDRLQAEEILHSLRSRGHDVFFDRSNLPPGENYEAQIEKAISSSDVFIFLVSQDSLSIGRFTLTELGIAEKRWPIAHRKVLPVLIRDTPIANIPPYLKSVTVLQPKGNIPAEVALAVDALGKRKFISKGSILIVAVVTLLSFYYLLRPNEEIATSVKFAAPFERGLFDKPELFNIGLELENLGDKAGTVEEVTLQTKPLDFLTVEKYGNVPPQLDKELNIGPGQKHTGHILVHEVDTPTAFEWRICTNTEKGNTSCSPYALWNPSNDFLYGDSFPIKEPLKSNSVAIAWDGEHYLIGTKSPNKIYKVDEFGNIISELTTEGVPVSFSIGSLGIFVSLKAPDTIVKLNNTSFTVENYTAIAFIDDIKGAFDEPLSTTPKSLAQDGENLWLLTGSGAGAAGLLNFDSKLKESTLPPYFEEISFDLDDMILRNGDGFVWSGQSATTPASVYRFNKNSYTSITGHDYEIVSCASDVIWHLEKLLLPDCEGRVTEIILDDNNILKVGPSVDYLSGYNSKQSTWETVTLAATTEGRLVGLVSTDHFDETRELVRSSTVLSTVGWTRGSSLRFNSDSTKSNAMAVGKESALIILESTNGDTQLVSPELRYE